MRRADLPFLILLSLVVLAGLAFRLPDLGNRPMHGDEAINTYKANELRVTHKFEYDPHEYHGPTLYFASLPAMWLGGGDYAATTEGTYRGVTVFFGVATIALLWFLREGLGRAETLAAGVFMALSPALAFYSRYYIHEPLLVFFTALALAAGWRYARTRKVGWALACGAGLGLMHATKETWVISVAAMVWGVILMLLWAWVVDREWPRPRRPLRWKVVAAGVVVAASVSVVFFSSFGRHARGPVDSVLTYVNYFKRGTGTNTDHVKPFDYYLRLLLWSQPVKGRSPVTTEALAFALAAAGGAAALARRGSRLASEGAHLVVAAPLPAVGGAGRGATSDDSALLVRWEDRRHWLLRFLAFYTLATGFFYSVISYKTPWCAMAFLHGVTLLAGVGAVALVRWMPNVVAKVVVGLAIAAGVVHLGYQAYRTSHVYPGDYRRNPFIYSQPGGDVLRFTRLMHDLAAASPEGYRMSVAVYTKDNWPLPWYLRRFERVVFSDGVPPSPDADVAIIGPDEVAPFEAAMQQKYKVDYIGLRPTVVLYAFIRQDLWDAYVESRSTVRAVPASSPASGPAAQ